MRVASFRFVAFLVAAVAVASPAAAQILERLPKVVADLVRDAEQHCRAQQGEPVYELAHMVRTYYMSAVAKGHETYVVTFDEFECVASEADESAFKERGETGPLFRAEPDRDRIFCEDDRCRIAVLLPTERNRWVKAFDGEVVTWVPQQRDDNVQGPNVRLRIVTVAPQCKRPFPETCNVAFRAAGGKLVEDR